MTRKTLTCQVCGFTVRRALASYAGCRGVHETPAVATRCPNGCGPIPDPDQPRVRRLVEIDVERG